MIEIWFWAITCRQHGGSISFQPKEVIQQVQANLKIF